MWTQDWSQDLLSFRSLNQESVDAVQTARSSSLVDGRLAHIVLSEEKNSSMSQNASLFETNCFFKYIFSLLYSQGLAPKLYNRAWLGLNFSPRHVCHPHTRTVTFIWEQMEGKLKKKAPRWLPVTTVWCRPHCDSAVWSQTKISQTTKQKFLSVSFFFFNAE